MQHLARKEHPASCILANGESGNCNDSREGRKQVSLGRLCDQKSILGLLTMFPDANPWCVTMSAPVVCAELEDHSCSTTSGEPDPVRRFQLNSMKIHLVKNSQYMRCIEHKCMTYVVDEPQIAVMQWT